MGLPTITLYYSKYSAQSGVQKNRVIVIENATRSIKCCNYTWNLPKHGRTHALYVWMNNDWACDRLKFLHAWNMHSTMSMFHTIVHSTASPLTECNHCSYFIRRMNRIDREKCQCHAIKYFNHVQKQILTHANLFSRSLQSNIWINYIN